MRKHRDFVHIEGEKGMYHTAKRTNTMELRSIIMPVLRNTIPEKRSFLIIIFTQFTSVYL